MPQLQSSAWAGLGATNTVFPERHLSLDPKYTCTYKLGPLPYMKDRILGIKQAWLSRCLFILRHQLTASLLALPRGTACTARWVPLVGTTTVSGSRCRLSARGQLLKSTALA